MDNKCLKVILPASVTADLPKFDEIIISFSNTAIYFSGNKTGYKITLENNEFDDGTTEKDLPTGGVKYVLKAANKNTKIHVTGKYNVISHLSTIDDLSKVKYMRALLILEAGAFYGGDLATSDNNCIGDLSDLPSGITTLKLGNLPQVTGTIDTLPSGITTLNIDNLPQVTGTIDSLPSGVATLYLNYLPQVTGTIAGLKGKYTGVFQIYSVPITGKLSDLGNKNNAITRICVTVEQGTGNYTPSKTLTQSRIEDLVAGFRAGGKTSGSILLFVNKSTNVTFNETQFYNPTSADVTLSWTATTITLNGVTINA